MSNNPHGYLTCEDVEHVYKRQSKALYAIAERGCRHCSAGDRALFALGTTYAPSGDAVEEERDELRLQVEALQAQLVRGERQKGGQRVSMTMQIIGTDPGKAAELTLWGTVKAVEEDGTIRVRWDHSVFDSWVSLEDLT